MELLSKSPRDVNTSRARVWQDSWAPMPWDYCRRTPFTETLQLTSLQTKSRCAAAAAAGLGPARVRAMRRRMMADHDADAYEHITSPKDRARIVSEPLPWNHRKKVTRIAAEEQQRAYTATAAVAASPDLPKIQGASNNVFAGSGDGAAASAVRQDPAEQQQDSHQNQDSQQNQDIQQDNKPSRTPRDLPTCRARVWQAEWDPMPWDVCRRTPWTETRGHGCGRYEESQRWATRQNRYRQYQVHFYGSPSDKEGKNSHLRACLKEQLSQLEPPHKQFVKRVGESQAVAEKTRVEEAQERERNFKRRQFLATFKDTNKMIMESKLKEVKEMRQTRARQERQTLSLNPINWTYSLW